MRETFGKMDIKNLIGRGEGAGIQLKTELNKNPGDRISYDLLLQDRSNGVDGDSDLEGNESALVYEQDDLLINLKRQAHSFRGMTQQRTVHDLRRDSRFSLSNWWAWFIEAGLFAHLAGLCGDSTETVVGALGGNTGSADWAGNTITAIDANHQVDGTAAGSFTLSLIDDAVAKAKTINPRVAPMMIGGREKYVMYLHPFQVRSLRQDATANQNNWNEIQREASKRGPDNPIYSGALGEYNGVILRESELLPRTETGDFNYALLLGQGAGCIAMGNAWPLTGSGPSGGEGSFFNWREIERDYGNKRGVAGISAIGFKRSQFASEAFGVIRVDTVDAAP
jgi:N4-gp56 family major capsid protein